MFSSIEMFITVIYSWSAHNSYSSQPKNTVSPREFHTNMKKASSVKL